MSTASTLASLQVMIVDDNADAADSLGVLLRLRGATVEVVHDGPKALTLLESFHPAAILLDLGMPGMDGFEVAQQIRLRPDGKDIVLLAQTGWGNQEVRRRSQEVGFDHHLVKPADFESLVSLLATVRERQGQPAPLERPRAE